MTLSAQFELETMAQRQAAAAGCWSTHVLPAVQEARALDAVLVFDEAESLFGARGESMGSSTNRHVVNAALARAQWSGPPVLTLH